MPRLAVQSKRCVKHVAILPRAIAADVAVGVALEGTQPKLVDPKVRYKDQRLAVRWAQPAIFVILKDDALACKQNGCKHAIATRNSHAK